MLQHKRCYLICFRPRPPHSEIKCDVCEDNPTRDGKYTNLYTWIWAIFGGARPSAVHKTKAMMSSIFVRLRFSSQEGVMRNATPNPKQQLAPPKRPRATWPTLISLYEFVPWPLLTKSALGQTKVGPHREATLLDDSSHRMLIFLSTCNACPPTEYRVSNL